MKRPFAYITAPWTGTQYQDNEYALHYCRQVYDAGYTPICPLLFLSPILNDKIPQEHKDGLAGAPMRAQRSGSHGERRSSGMSEPCRCPLRRGEGYGACDDAGRDFLRRSHVLVVCGESVTEAMKNDIATAERLHITATTLDGILTVKGQGRSCGKK